MEALSRDSLSLPNRGYLGGIGEAGREISQNVPVSCWCIYGKHMQNLTAYILR